MAAAMTGDWRAGLAWMAVVVGMIVAIHYLAGG
jgi:hypothetical protein